MHHTPFPFVTEVTNITTKDKKSHYISLTRDYNKYIRSPNSKILLTSSSMHSQILSNYNDLMYCNTLNSSKSDTINFTPSISVRPLTSKRVLKKEANSITTSKKTYPYVVCSKRDCFLPHIKSAKNRINMMLCGSNTKRDIKAELEAIENKKNKEKLNKNNKNIGFKNQTLSSIFKIDHTLFKLNPKVKKEILSMAAKKRKIDSTIEKEHKEGKTIVAEQLMNLLTSGNKYGTGRKVDNYVNKMEREIKKNIKKNEYKVKDTMDNLRRLQRDNDDNLNRVSFIKKIVFK